MKPIDYHLRVLGVRPTRFAVHAVRGPKPAVVTWQTFEDELSAIGIVDVVKGDTQTLEWFDPTRPEGKRWYDVRGVEWNVVTSDVLGEYRRQGIATKLYEAAAEEVRRRGGTYFASDTIRSTASEGFWRKQADKKRAVFMGDRYVMNLKMQPARIDLSGAFTGVGFGRR